MELGAVSLAGLRGGGLRAGGEEERGAGRTTDYGMDDEVGARAPTTVLTCQVN